MIQLKNLELPSSLVTFTDMKVNVEYALRARILSMSNYSGYPLASNVTGRLQRLFDFSSMESILKSCITNRNMVKFAGDVLALVPIMRTDKYQMSRADVGAFITNHAAAHGMSQLSTEDIDFISYLMTSSESMVSNWVLEHTDSPDANLHLLFAKLYGELLTSLGTDRVETIHCYDADSDKITTLQETPRGSMLAAEMTKRKVKTKIKGTEVSQEETNELQYMITVEVLASMRMLDHLHSLFMSIEPWHIFISPRTTADTNTNQTRSKSLQLMAGYLHSVMLYPYHLKAEMFLGLYDKVQKWLIPLPEMPVHLKEQYDLTIRNTDTLGAMVDAHSVLGINDFERSDVINSNINNFFREQIGLLGLTNIDNLALAEAAKVVNFNLNDLKTLGEPQYQSTLLAQPVKQLTIVPSVAQALMVADVMENFVMNCSSSIAGLSSRFHTPEVLDKLKTLAFRVEVTYLPKISPTLNPQQSSPNNMIKGKLMYSSHLPANTRSYDLHIQRELINSIFTPNSSMNNFNTKYIINDEVRESLQKLIPKFGHTLMPESLHSGSHSYSRTAILASVETRKSLIEQLTDISYPLFTRAVVSNLFLMDLATVFSSFALIYTIPGQVGVGDIYKIKTNGAGMDGQSFQQIHGYGSPYGTDYKGLADIQGTIAASDYLPIAPGVAMVLLSKIPSVTMNLKIEADFINQHPYPYFSANGETIEVGDLVMAKPMTNFALMPAPLNAYSPAKFFLDRNYVFQNQQVYIEVNLNQIATPSSSSDGFNAPFQVRSWGYEKYSYFAQYITPGTYGPVGVATSVHDETTSAGSEAKRISDMVKQAEEKMAAMDVNKPTDIIANASPNLVKESDVKVEITAGEPTIVKPVAKHVEVKKEDEPIIESEIKKEEKKKDEDTEDDVTDTN